MVCTVSGKFDELVFNPFALPARLPTRLPACLSVYLPVCQATAHEDLKRLLGKAQAIDELESTIPSFIEKLMPHNYPAFVHVLRVSRCWAEPR